MYLSSDKDIPLNTIVNELKFLSKLVTLAINSSLDVSSENGKIIVICGAIRLANGSYLFLISCILLIFLNFRKIKISRFPLFVIIHHL